jgi:two-component system, sensor histidine kinase and response regulator
VTQRKIGEEELRRARDEALRASRLKSEFVANVSHEIRTPMNGVLAMTELLLRSDLTPKQCEAAETIRVSAESLLSIINDILDFSKIEAGMLQLEERELDLMEVVDRVIGMLAERTQAKGLMLTSVIAPDLPQNLRGDPARMHQVLINLISNAVKFTPSGAVSVYVKLERESPVDATVGIEVHDTGIGLSQEAQRRLFQPFTQADGSTTRKFGGTGLGLVISKQLVELMGGEIWVESVLGKGSTFRFTAQLAKVTSGMTQPGLPDKSRQIAPASTYVPKKCWRILVADDNPVNQSVAKL